MYNSEDQEKQAVSDSLIYTKQLDLQMHQINMLNIPILSQNLQYQFLDRYLWDVEKSKLYFEFKDLQASTLPLFTQDSEKFIYIKQLNGNYHISIYQIIKNIETLIELQSKPFQIRTGNEKELIVNHEEGFSTYHIDNYQLLRKVLLEKIKIENKQFAKTKPVFLMNQFFLRYLENQIEIHNQQLCNFKKIYKIINQWQYMGNNGMCNQNWLLIRVLKYIYIFDFTTLRYIKKIKIEYKHHHQQIQSENANYILYTRKEKCQISQRSIYILSMQRFLPTFKIYSDRIIQKSENVASIHMQSSPYVICNTVEKMVRIYDFQTISQLGFNVTLFCYFLFSHQSYKLNFQNAQTMQNQRN